MPPTRRQLLPATATALPALLGTPASEDRPVATATITRGDLKAAFRDNSQSPKVLSGVASLVNQRDAPGFDAFDPDSPGASAGLNFERIISGHRNANNAFAPRHGKYALYLLPDDQSVRLARRQEGDPWALSSTLT
jgi:hypothetical protein